MNTSRIHWFVAGSGAAMLSVGASIAPGFAQAPAVELVPGSAPTVIVAPSIIQQPVIIDPVAAQVCSEGNNVELRTGPNQIFPVVASLMPGTPLSVQRTQINRLGREWSFVYTSGVQGFIPAGHVCY